MPVFFTLLLCSVGYAHGRCGAEAKLLVSPTHPQQALASLDAGKPSRGQVYLYDTDQLDLLSQGLIVRLRTGPKGDLTIKLRSLKEEPCTCPSEVRETANCEADLVGSATLTSYSVRKAWKGAAIPETGRELHSALSADQLKVLRAAGVSVDWPRVQRKVEIQASDWEARPPGPLKKVSIELWEWPGGRILELSAKADLRDGTAALRELRALAERYGLSVPENQVTKTNLVLHARPVSHVE